MAKGGRCYMEALKYLESRTDGRLVHGIVTGQKQIEGVRYGHAWVEFEEDGMEFVYDTTNEKVFPRVLYYAVGQITDTKSYSLEEAYRECLKHRHYGPWDSVISEAVHNPVRGKKRRSRP